MTNRSPGCMSVLPMCGSSSTLPSTRTTVLRPNAPGSPPTMPNGGWVGLLGGGAPVIPSGKAPLAGPPVPAAPLPRAAAAVADRIAFQPHREAELQDLRIGQARVGHIGLHDTGAVEARPGAGAA